MRKPVVSAEAIKSCLAKWNAVTDLRPCVEGEESRVYCFRSKAQEYILRVNRVAGGFEKDALAYRKFRSSKVPIPEVIEIGNIGEEYAYCVSRRVTGVTLQDLSTTELPCVLAPTAAVLHAIATTDLDGLTGFGNFDAFGVGSHSSWRAFLSSIGDSERHDWNAASLYIDMSRITRFLDLLNELVEYCPESRALVHGDFGSNNVLTDGRQITGVIDWSEALIGDPLYDVANLFFWRTWLDCMEQQARYFEAQLDSMPRMRERLLCYQLRIGLSEIYDRAIAREKTAEWAMSRCDEVVRQSLL